MPLSVLADTVGIGRPALCTIEAGIRQPSSYLTSALEAAIHDYQPPGPEEWFWRKVDQSGGLDTCWPWNGSIDTKGYGYLHLGAFKAAAFTGEQISTLRAPSEKGRKYLAHRTAWTLTWGPIPTGLSVLHHCDHRPCCNPHGDQHLFLGTQQDNVDDMLAKGRGVFNGTPGERNGHSKLTQEAVVEIRSLAALGFSQTEISHRYGVKPNNICAIVNYKTWKNVT